MTEPKWKALGLFGTSGRRFSAERDYSGELEIMTSDPDGNDTYSFLDHAEVRRLIAVLEEAFPDAEAQG